MTIKEFADGWKHFCKCINFEFTALDAKAIRFMNEMPIAVSKGLVKDSQQVQDEIIEDDMC